MQKQADQMMTSGIGSEQAPVEHVGEHSQRMPISPYNGCRCPFNGLQIYSLLYLIVSGEIFRIIEINKIISRYSAEDG
jgi:hypothetical protein